MVDVGVQRSDRHQDRVRVLAELADVAVADADRPQALFPVPGGAIRQGERIDAGFVEFEVPPEQAGKFHHKLP